MNEPQLPAVSKTVNATELLQSALSHTESLARRQQSETGKYLQAGQIAIKAVLLAGHAGNVTCRQAALEILLLLR